MNEAGALWVPVFTCIYRVSPSLVGGIPKVKKAANIGIIFKDISPHRALPLKHYIVLHCIVLYAIVLYCIVIVLYWIILYCIDSHCIVLVTGAQRYNTIAIKSGNTISYDCHARACIYKELDLFQIFFALTIASRSKILYCKDVHQILMGGFSIWDAR